MTKVAALSLFSGAGGLDVASHLAGVPVVSSNDVENDCIETLKSNAMFENSRITLGNLFETTSKQLIEGINYKDFNKLIVIGGAPCQPFSKNGYWVGNNIRKGINDPRAQLVNEYLRVITDLGPEGFVFENVESLLHPTNINIFESFLNIVNSLGYDNVVVKANALNYGVPQKRKRVFIIGTKGKFTSDQPRITHFPPHLAKEHGLKPYVTVGEVISEFDDKYYFEEYEITRGGTYHTDLCEVPPGQNYKALTAWAGHVNPKFVADKRFWNFLLKLSPDLPSWTITAQPGPWVGPFHWNNRRLRTPEIAAIQSFPREYKFYGSRRSIQKQIGNAVPPLMGKVMIEFLKESLS